MFVSDEVRLPVDITAAAARLIDLARSGTLLEASERAYDDAKAGLQRAESPPGSSEMVRVDFRDVVWRGESAVLTLHWEADGAIGKLFPALDADITICPGGSDASLLRLDGAYLAPLGAAGHGPDSLVLHRAASATVHAFIDRVADLVAQPVATDQQPLARNRHLRRRGSRSCGARLPSGGKRAAFWRVVSRPATGG